MTGGKAEVPWKQFERVVARIERSLAPLRAVVKLNDHILQPSTKELRQVDASIRFKVGSAEILITIECRRHKDTQDITWIEQLVQKKVNIGANATIAVSASGFTAPAKKAAADNNIHIRTLKDLEQSEVKDWMRVVNLDLEIRTYSIKRIGIQPFDKVQAELTFDEGLKTKYAEKLDQYPLFVRSKDNQRFTAFEPIRLSEQQGANWFRDCTPDSPMTHILKWENHDRGICVETTVGLIPVKFIFVEFITRIERKKIPLSNIFRYSAGEAPLLEGVEFDISDAIPGAVLAIHRDKQTGQSAVKLIQEEQKDRS